MSATAPVSVDGTVESRYDGVQALRFLAALLVVVTHSTFYAHERLTPGVTVWENGVTGVDIFFVISGFVIVLSSRRLFGTRHAAGDFMARRLIRIVPLYWIATTVNLAVLLAAPSTVLHSNRNWWNIVSSYLFLPSHDADGKLEPLLGVGWTLNFEMFFYVVFALALLLRRNRTVVIGLVGSVMVLCALGSLWNPPGDPAYAFYLSPRVVEFLAGMLLAVLVARRRIPVALGAVLLAVGLLTLLLGPEFLPPLPFLLRKGLPALLVVAGVVGLEPVLAPRLPKGVLLLGAASYAIYLFHPMAAPVVPAVLAKLGVGDGPVAVAGTVSVIGSVVVAVTAATVLHLVLERPLTDRLGAARRRREKARDASLDSPVPVGGMDRSAS